MSWKGTSKVSLLLPALLQSLFPLTELTATIALCACVFCAFVSLCMAQPDAADNAKLLGFALAHQPVSPASSMSVAEPLQASVSSTAQQGVAKAQSASPIVTVLQQSRAHQHHGTNHAQHRCVKGGVTQQRIAAALTV